MPIFSLFESINGPLWLAVQATGKIKKYQIIVSCLIFSNLPFSIIAFSLGANPYCVLIIRIILECFITIFRLLYLNKTQKFSIGSYLKNVMIPVLVVMIVSFFITSLISSYFSGLVFFFGSCAISVIVNMLLVCLVGINKNERKMIVCFFKRG